MVPLNDAICKDYNQYCGAWAAGGECRRNAGFMLLYCRGACDACGRGDGSGDIPTTTPQAQAGRDCNYFPPRWCRQFLPDCWERAEAGECESDPDLMLVNCPMDCGICGPNEVCTNYDINCEAWEEVGECERSPAYMEIYCKGACRCCG